MVKFYKWVIALWRTCFTVTLIQPSPPVRVESWGGALQLLLNVRVDDVDDMPISDRRAREFITGFESLEHMYLGLVYIRNQLDNLSTSAAAAYIDSLKIPQIDSRLIRNMDDFLSNTQGHAIPLEFYYDDLLITLQAIDNVYVTLEGSVASYYQRRLGHILTDVYAWIDAST